jgi:hypothetical protein
MTLTSYHTLNIRKCHHDIRLEIFYFDHIKFIMLDNEYNTHNIFMDFFFDKYHKSNHNIVCSIFITVNGNINIYFYLLKMSDPFQLKTHRFNYIITIYN